MTEKEYLPYKTINVFIEQDYLRHILEFILQNINLLPKEDQITFGSSFREHVNILGFRNPMRAPLPLQLNAYINAFEEKDEIIPFTLSTWTKLNKDFAKEVKEWLESEGWKELSLTRVFNETEGFINNWPADLTFEKLKKEFKKAHPDLDFDEDDLILMILWISGQLPEKEHGL